MSALYRYSNENWRFTLPDSVEDAETAAHWNSLQDNYISGHEVQIGEVIDSIARGERPPVSGTEARRILEFIASLYKAAMTRRPVQRGEITLDDPFYQATNGVSQKAEAL